MVVSTLAYALLGLLAREPLSGNDLAQRLRGRFSFLWPADHSQILPELASLETASLIGHTVVAQQGRPDKQVYAINDAGLAALRAWVSAPTEIHTPRDEFILKAYTLWMVAPQEGAVLFREHERRHSDRLALYEGQLAWLERTHGERLRQPGTPLFSTYITLRHGIGVEREYTEWCGWVAEQIERHDNEAVEREGSSEHS